MGERKMKLSGMTHKRVPPNVSSYASTLKRLYVVKKGRAFAKLIPLLRLF